MGGWAFVVCRNGQEINHDSGGIENATNNIAELTALLRALEWISVNASAAPATIWSDSQYAVRGANEWRHGWKRNGWQRGSDKAERRNRHLANADLWQAIDEALSGPRAGSIAIRWIKGHAGNDGNMRADELASIGRASLDIHDPALALDREYGAIMGGLYDRLR